MFRILVIVLIMGGIQIVNMLSGYSLVQFGLVPRTIHGLLGIITAPWLHGSMLHFFGNIVTFVVLASLCLFYSVRYFTVASVFIIIVSGFYVWIFGHSAIHVGASAWIFGLWTLLMANAVYERTFKSILIGFLVLFFYGGLLFGLLPEEGVSFEGHIGGAISGVLFAWLVHRQYINVL